MVNFSTRKINERGILFYIWFLICWMRIFHTNLQAVSLKNSSNHWAVAAGTIELLLSGSIWWFNWRFLTVFAEHKGSVFGVFLVRIFPHLDWIRRYTNYLFVFSKNAENTDQKCSEYGHFDAVLTSASW